MKKLFILILGIASLAVAPNAPAFRYGETDLLLVFRADGYNDLVFNLGSVSNFLGKPYGTVLPVSGFSKAALSNNFDGVLTGVSCILCSESSTSSVPRVWLSNASLGGGVTDLSGSRWSQIQGKINGVGVNAVAYTGSANTNVYSVASSDPNSYTYIVSQGFLNVATMGGSAPFPVENAIPCDLAFYELKINNGNPKPAATRVGTFTVTATGNLTFTAGGQPPLVSSSIKSITRTAGVSTVRFTTVNGLKYSLRFKTAINGNWNTLPGSLTGSGADGQLTDATTDSFRFYQVQTSY